MTHLSSAPMYYASEGGGAGCVHFKSDYSDNKQNYPQASIIKVSAAANDVRRGGRDTMRKARIHTNWRPPENLISPKGNSAACESTQEPFASPLIPGGWQAKTCPALKD